MNKKMYTLIPLALMVLSFPSCNKNEIFSMGITDEKEEVPETVEGWKTKTSFVDGVLDNTAENTYDNGLLTESRLIGLKIKDAAITSTNTYSRYEYNKNGLETLERVDECDGNGLPAISDSNVSEYDEHNNRTKYTKTHDDLRRGTHSTSTTNVVYTYNDKGKESSEVYTQIEDDEVQFKSVRSFQYDKDSRLISVTKKNWDNDFDNPDGYDAILSTNFTYEGRKVTRVNESLQGIRGGEPEKNKEVVITEFNDDNKRVSFLGYTYKTNTDIVIKTRESYWEYNAQGLEINCTSYESSMGSPVSKISYINHEYCGRGNNKLKRYTSFAVQVRKLSNEVTTNDKTNFKSVYNEYDGNERVVRQEIMKAQNSAKGDVSITTNTFTY